MHIHHEPLAFFTMTRFSIHVRNIASLSMKALTRSATSAFIAMFQSSAWPLYFCMTGLLTGVMLRPCSITCLSMPVRWVGFHAKIVEYCVKSATKHALVSPDRWAPIRTSWYGYYAFTWCCSVGQSSFEFFGAHTNLGANMIWCQCCALVFVAIIVVDPWCVVNLTMPCIVNGTNCSREITDRSSRILCSVGNRVTENSIVLVTLSLSSWLTNVKGNRIVPNSHKLWLVNSTNGPLVRGLSPFFHVSGSYLKQCL